METSFETTAPVPATLSTETTDSVIIPNIATHSSESSPTNATSMVKSTKPEEVVARSIREQSPMTETKRKIFSRRFKSPYWDIPPEGFNQPTTHEYKALQAAGKIPHSVVNPSSQHLQGTRYARGNRSTQDALTVALAAAAKINELLPTLSSASNLTRRARRLYIGNIPFDCTNKDIVGFFEQNMQACNFPASSGSGSPVVRCELNMDKNFAFLEFRTVEETTIAMALDGISFKGQTLKIRRPHDYQPVSGLEPAPKVMSPVICLMNMVEPSELCDDHEYYDIMRDIREECSKYGRVISMEMPRPDSFSSGSSSKKKRHGYDNDHHNHRQSHHQHYHNRHESNTISNDTASSLVPRLEPGVGKVFVEFDNPTEAQRAQQNLAGRRFADRLVVTSFFDLDRYRNKEF